jgi:hypothetical protein
MTLVEVHLPTEVGALLGREPTGSGRPCLADPRDHCGHPCCNKDARQVEPQGAVSNTKDVP